MICIKCGQQPLLIVFSHLIHCFQGWRGAGKRRHMTMYQATHCLGIAYARNRTIQAEHRYGTGRGMGS